MQTQSQKFIKKAKTTFYRYVNKPLLQKSEVLCRKYYYCLKDTKIKASEQ